MTFELHLSEKSISLLHTVLGQPITSLFSSTLRAQVGEDVFIYGHDFSFALRSTAGFLTLRTGEWFDTPFFAMNCFELCVERHEQPYGFATQFNTPALEWHPPFNDITLGQYLVPITRVDIYTIERFMSDTTTQERVQFDHAIRFQRSNGSQFCFVVADESIVGDLMLYWDSTAIAQVLSASHVRHTIQ